MNFEEFLHKIEFFIQEEFKTNKYSEEFLFEVIPKTQKYILDEIINLKIKDNEASLTYEKVAQLINYIEDIVEYELNKKNLGANFEKLKHIFVDTFNFNLIENVLEEIKNKTKCEASYVIDSKNTVRDLKHQRTFEQYVHATANSDTKDGQGKLLFNVDIIEHKHIYILNTIIKEAYKGTLIIKNEKISLINLLPFMSMLSKITQNGSKKTLHENLTYLFKTPLIIIGDKIWKTYNKEIAKIYSLDEIQEYEWFYSEYFEKNAESIIFKQLMIYLKNYTLDVINLIALNNINYNLQNNEKLILQQLYNLTKSIIFFDKENQFIDYDFINKTSELLEQIEFFDSEYSTINIKNFKQISYKKISKEIINSDQNLLHAFHFMRHKMVYEINHLNKSELNFHNFVLELGKAFNFSDKFSYFINKCKNKSLKEVFQEDKFNKIINNEAFKDKNQTLSILCELIFLNFPTFGKKAAKIKFKNKQEKEDFYLIFFVVLGYLPINKEFFINFNEKVKSSFAGDYSYIEKLKNEELQRIFLISEILYPQNKLNFDIKEDLKIKEVIYKYIYYYYLNDFSKIDLLEMNNLNGITLEKHKKFDSIIREENFIFEFIMSWFDSEKYIPVEYAQVLMETLSPYIIIKFINYLDKTNNKSYLKESLLWFLSIKNFNMQLINY